MTRFDDLVVTKWGARFQGRRVRCAVGRGGIGAKSGEGDNVTPRGTWHLAEVWQRPDRIRLTHSALKTQQIGPADIWSDDPADPAYNAHRKAICGYDYSHEVLRRADPMYDIFAVTNFNWPKPKPGAGSAIFLHVWKKPRHPTAGCVAFNLDDLVHILARWTTRSRLVIR